MKKNTYSIQNSTLYKKNVKIHKNLWKPYSIALAISILLIVAKGIN